MSTSVEQLTQAINRHDMAEVKRLLESGVDVNEVWV